MPIPWNPFSNASSPAERPTVKRSHHHAFRLALRPVLRSSKRLKRYLDGLQVRTIHFACHYTRDRRQVFHFEWDERLARSDTITLTIGVIIVRVRLLNIQQDAAMIKECILNLKQSATRAKWFKFIIIAYQPFSRSDSKSLQWKRRHVGLGSTTAR